MGEVYRARDTRLDRVVAIKVLPAHAATDERRQRFEREARAISALNHPHICVLHDVGQHDGSDFLVMEYLEGESLADRLRRGALPLDQALRFGMEIADALDKAHRHGIVHRDLKPGNVMLAKSGAKLLDFGLAKLRAPEMAVAAGPELSAYPTGDKPLTAEGSLVGTFQYMAPEQLEGREPDGRADIFALGALLYEMATGERAFKGSSQASLIAAILAAEPAPISRLRPLAPPALDRVVATCLAKDPDDRWQSAHDLGKELKWIHEADSAGGPTPAVAPARRHERIAWTAAVMAAGLLGFVLSARRGAAPAPTRTIRATLPPPSRTTLGLPDSLSIPALSPDGGRVAFVARSEDGRDHVWVRPLDGEPRVLAGTEGAVYPFWSADSRSIGFFADGKLKKVDSNGGPPEVLCDAAAGRGGTWNRDGVIVFSGQPGLGLSQVSAAGGAPTPVTRIDAARHETSHRWPSFLPDGRHFLYSALVAVTPTQSDGVYLAELGSDRVRRVVEARSNAVYAEPGYLLFARDGALVAQPFDVDSGRLTGDAVALADQVLTFPAVAAASFSVSDAGQLAYLAGTPDEKAQILWSDRTGAQGPTGIPTGSIDSPRLSRDGRRIAYRVEDRQGRGDIWIYDLARRLASRFTFDSANDFGPVWSPDDSHIAFSSNRATGGDVYVKASSGDGAEQLVFSSPDRKTVTQWGGDGRRLLFGAFALGATRADIWSLSLPDSRPTAVVQTQFMEGGGQISPDGRWLAYHTNESGRMEVYVQPFPGPGPKWRVSRDGGQFARWRGDGKEIFFVAGDRTLMAAEVAPETAFGAGDPRALFSLRPRPRTLDYPYDVSADGRRFLVNVTSSDEFASAITLVVDWAAGLKR
jgi:Tol biopolymer transport system component/aminoglycoside phosphotransferase (APT) family kinase protein